MNEDLKHLRKFFDADDVFMSGHQPKKQRTLLAAVPAWALSDESLQTLLLAVFPKLKTDDRQRRSAGRWAAVIHMTYRVSMTRSQVAASLKIRREAVRMILKRARWAASHVNSDGSVRIGARGRPRKGDPTPATLEGDIKQGPNEALTSTSLHRTDQGSGGDSRASSAQEVSLQEESHR